MRDSLEKLCNDFIANRNVVDSVFKWENDMIVAVCAATFMDKGMNAEAEKLERCKKLLKESTSIFSNFRGNVELPIVSLLAVAENPEEKLEKTKKNYQLLKEHFNGSEYLVLAAAILADMPALEQVEEVAERARAIYDKMKEDHPFLTSSEDNVYAVLMALAEKSDEALMEEMEACYKLLKEEFFSGNDVQSLAHVLAMADGSAKEKCDKVVALYDALKEAGVKYGKSYELTVLGSLALVPVDKETMIADMKDVDVFLAEQKGYGLLGIDKKTRLMHAAMIVANDYSDRDVMGVAAMTGTLSVLAAQQAALCAVVAATAVSSASAAGGN